MPTLLVKSRHHAYICQSQRCFYCNAPMWEGDPTSFVAQYRVPKRLAQRLQCTAEHLTPKCDGGADSKENIVAACLHCNSTRHKFRTPPDPERYRQHVQRRVAQGKWQPKPLQPLLRSRG